MLKSKPIPTYNDGTVTIYAETVRETDFGAKRNVESVSEMEKVTALRFAEASCRAQDFEFAERRSFNLTRKIRTHNRTEVTPEHRAVIDGQLYDIEHIDRTQREMFLYLGGGRNVNA